MSTVTAYGAHVAVQVLAAPTAAQASVYGQAVYGSGARYTGSWPWTEVECQVTGASWQVGASTPAGPLTRVESGSLTVAMWDPDGQWAPRLGRLPLRTPVRLLAGPTDAAMRPVWTGWLEQVDWTPDAQGRWTLSLSGDDVIRQLSAWPTGSVNRPAETAGARIAGLAAAVPPNTGSVIPYPVIGTYTGPNRSLAAITVDASVWDGMQDVADADLAWLSAGPDAVVTGVALPTAPSWRLAPCPDPAHPAGPLPYTWSWYTTSTGTIAPNGTATGVLITADPRSADYYCRANGDGVLPAGTPFRAACRMRLTSGTPDGTLRGYVGGGTQTGATATVIPADGSWVTVAGTATTVDPAGVYAHAMAQVRFGGTARVTVEVDGLTMWDTTQVVYVDRTDRLTADSIVNSVSVTRAVPEGQTAPPPVVAADSDSVNRYLPAGLERTLPLPDDTASGLWASQVLGWLSRPRPHIAGLNVAASRLQSDPATIDLLSRLYPPARVTVAGDGGTVEHLVVGAVHDLGPDQWSASLALMPAPYDSTQVYGRPLYGQVRYGGVSI